MSEIHASYAFWDVTKIVKIAVKDNKLSFTTDNHFFEDSFKDHKQALQVYNEILNLKQMKINSVVHIS